MRAQASARTLIQEVNDARALAHALTGLASAIDALDGKVMHQTASTGLRVQWTLPIDAPDLITAEHVAQRLAVTLATRVALPSSKWLVRAEALDDDEPNETLDLHQVADLLGTDLPMARALASLPSFPPPLNGEGDDRVWDASSVQAHPSVRG